jgi:hypothetical protein
MLLEGVSPMQRLLAVWLTLKFYEVEDMGGFKKTKFKTKYENKK